jgi:mannosyl-oligosaccharide alpha-1,2-mannosidase
LILEWTRLSDLSGDRKYFDLTKKAQDKVMAQNLGANMKDKKSPGLIGEYIDLNTGISSGNTHWDALADSYYEYLMKTFVYDPRRFDDYGRAYKVAARSAMNNLTTITEYNDRNYTYMTQLEPGRTGWLRPQKPTSRHLACFAGGSFLLASAGLQDQDLRGFGLSSRSLEAFGLKLVEGCYKSYTRMASGIGPEAFSVLPGTIDPFARGYILRPEVLESIYYAYRVTGNTKYQDWSWELFSHIRNQTTASHGFSGIWDVTKADGGGQDDNQESFFFAETLKYAYMTQADVVCVLPLLDPLPNGDF